MKFKKLFLFAWLGAIAALQAQPAAVAGGADSSTPASPPMDNVTISIKGAIGKDLPVDFTFTTAGPDFSLDQLISQVRVNGNIQPVIGTCQVAITPLATGFRVQYQLGARMPVVSGMSAGVGGQKANPVTATVVFDSMTFSGSVILKPGQPVTILNSDGKDVTITLTKPVAL